MKRAQLGGFDRIPSAFSFIKQQVEKELQAKRLIDKNRRALLKRIGQISVATAILVAVNAPHLMAESNEVEQIIDQQQPVFETELTLNRESPTLLAIPEEKIEIKVGMSVADQEAAAARARLLAAKNKSKAGRQIVMAGPQTTQYLSVEEAHRIAKEAAAELGISEHWKILAAVHQKETGKRGDSCIVSRADGRATGPFQFMPGTFAAHAPVGANICSVRDASRAAAHLLKHSGLDQGDARRALYSYNRSQQYVNSVMAIANSIQE